jgi:c-di-GMP-binding flagellar brake protein YcgR
VKLKRPVTERRKWPRLPLAIPIFVRGRLQQDREFLEFATALNVSGGGMLVALRHSLPPESEVCLEIPSAPLVALHSLPKGARTLRAKVLRTSHADSYNLVGLRFVRPLIESSVKTATQRRKQPILV